MTQAGSTQAVFTGFPPETVDFLRRLGENNTASWFTAHRDDYEEFYVAPAKAFTIAAGGILRHFVPTIRAEPRILGSIFRINRDIRFSRDKRPYKDHIDLWFWEGERKRAASGMFVRVGPRLVGIGAGCHGFDRDQLGAFRRAASDPLAMGSLHDLASRLASEGYQLSGDPTPTSRFLYVHVDAPVELALQPALLDTCEIHWRRLAPLHRWLVDHVQRPLDPSV